MDGTIHTLTDRGFGFLDPISGNSGKTLFFHSKELVGILFDELRVGDLVNFEVIEGPKGPVAVNVGRNGGSIGRHTWKAEKVEPETERARILISEVIEGFRHLTPELIQHLRRHSEDIERINSSVFEHLIGELLLSEGWHQVRLVGRNPRTSADIFALHYIPSPGGIAMRFFVEVKRWKDRIGVEVINQVIGAMVSERERHGWHAAIIVALGGASNTRAFSQEEYRMKGIEVKDKEDVLGWLRNYKPNGDGLWLAPNFSSEIEI